MAETITTTTSTGNVGGFGQLAGTIQVGQSFTTGAGGTVSSLLYNLRKDGSPTTLTVTLRTDNSNKPSSTILATEVYVNGAGITGTETDYFMPDAVDVVLAPATKYWLMFAPASAGGSGNGYGWGGDDPDSYAGGINVRGDDLTSSAPDINRTMRAVIVLVDPASGPVNLKKYMGVAKASIKKVAPVAIASIKKLLGVA